MPLATFKKYLHLRPTRAKLRPAIIKPGTANRTRNRTNRTKPDQRRATTAEQPDGTYGTRSFYLAGRTVTTAIDPVCRYCENPWFEKGTGATQLQGGLRQQSPFCADSVLAKAVACRYGERSIVGGSAEGRTIAHPAPFRVRQLENAQCPFCATWNQGRRTGVSIADRTCQCWNR